MPETIQTIWHDNPNNIERIKKIAFDYNISYREIEVIIGICQEKTSAQIANVLYLSSRSVEWIRQQLMKKMNFKSSIGIVVFAIKSGLYII